jgi:sugar-specific transcriptional regulator TrmB
MTIIDEKTLVNLGLTHEQVKIYLFLLNNGISNAKNIALKTGLGRPLVYKVLDQLKALKLVDFRENIGKITLFQPNHPSILKSYIQEKKSQLDNSIKIFDKHYGLLASKFNVLTGKPNIIFMEGLNGLQEMYDDILNEGQNIRLIRSLLDHKDPKVASILRTHIDKQAKKGIKVDMVGPPRYELTTEEMRKKDEARLVTRKVMPENFLIPSQVIIYGNKVAITDFKGEIITTIIENPDVRETFEKMFDFMFQNAKPAY